MTDKRKNGSPKKWAAFFGSRLRKLRFLLAKCKKPDKRKIGLGLLALVLLAGALCGINAATDPYDCKMLDNVSIGGLDVGGMTFVQACQHLRQASETVLEGTDLTAHFPEESLVFTPEETKVSVKVLPAVFAAFRYGRSNTPSDTQEFDVGLLPYLRVDTEAIRTKLEGYAEKYNTDCTPSSYVLDGAMPDLEVEKQNGMPACQTLQITMGLPTARFEVQEACSQILAVYDRAFSAHGAQDYAVHPESVVTIWEEPEKPDLQSIYDTLYVAAVDDSLDMENYVPIPGSYGYHFDLEKAETLVANARYGETVAIPMECVEPELFGEEVYFRDVLGYCETPHTKDENRNNNLRQACKSMNGLILQPGEVFSYNDTLGERTKERGYLRAGAYSGWELVQSYGGGICQGSSTIYCAALYADLEIVFRRNHGYAVGYIDYGLDATVNWGGPDFQFRNNTHFPIRINAEVSDGLVKVTILGTEERDYYVKMESEAAITENHIYAKSFKCKYDRKTDELISRELEARSTYNR